MRRLGLVLFLLMVLLIAAPPQAGAFDNGKARTSELSEIYRPGGKSYLAKDAAPAWNSFRFCEVTKYGQDIYAGGPRSAYRAYSEQVYFWNLYRSGRGNLAARPGTSNHGWGRAIDLGAKPMRVQVDRRGGSYRWKKVEAWSEWWHVNYVGGWSQTADGPDPGISQRYPVIRERSGKKNTCLREAVKEAERRLGLEQSGFFSESDVKKLRIWKKRNGLPVTSSVDQRTWDKLRSQRSDGKGPDIKPPSKTDKPAAGVDVRAAQGLLNSRFKEMGSSTRVEVDGVYGQQTANAIREFQALSNLVADGVIGPKTWDALRKPGARAPPFSASTLQRAMPGLSTTKAKLYAPHLSAAMVEAEITKLKRAQFFLAQLGHESVSLRYFEEIASGAAYEGRRDLGNTQRGDGKRFKGRGPIQLTGRYNYRAAGKALKLPLESNPYLAARPEVGFRVAGWYWTSRGLNAYSDRGDFRGVTRRINGGYNGLSDRYRRLAIIEKLGSAVLPKPPDPLAILTKGERALIEELEALRAQARKSGSWTGTVKDRADEIKHEIRAERMPELRALVAEGGKNKGWRALRYATLKHYYGPPFR